MRIAFVIPDLHNHGGTERCFAGLGRALARRGHDIVLFAANFDRGVLPSARWWKVPRIQRPHLVRFFAFVVMSALVRWLARLRGERWDVLVSSGPDAPHADVVWFHCCAATLAEQIANEKARGLARLRALANIAAYRSIALVERAIVNSNSAGISVSRSLEQDLIAQAGNTSDSNLRVIHNGVDLEDFGVSREGRDRVRSEWGIAADARAVLFVGHNWRRKGLLTLLQALEEVRKQRPELNLCLVVAGGPTSPGGSQPTSFPVRWLGTRNDLANVYSACDVFVLPSVLESFAMPVLEAMACGMPAIVSASAGVAEISTGDDLITLDDPSSTSELMEKLLPLLESGDLCREIGERARRTAAHYSWDAVAEYFEAVCASALVAKTADAGDPEKPETQGGT